MGGGSTNARMASRFNLHTKEPKVATLFDYMAPGMTNLKMGAPGEAMLKKCAEAMKKAAVHRMVCTGGGGFSDPPVLGSSDTWRTQWSPSQFQRACVNNHRGV